jgi:hypothetical protein
MDLATNDASLHVLIRHSRLLLAATVDFFDTATTWAA